jgi:uncharacterized protein (DUF1330 family)
MNLANMMAAVSAGILLASGGAGTFAAERVSAAPPAFYVAEFEVTDADGMKPYSANVESTFTPYGGHFIVRGGTYTSLEGKAPSRKRVVIEFESVEKALSWYHSEEYTALRKIRQRSAKTDVYIVEGIAPR